MNIDSHPDSLFVIFKNPLRAFYGMFLGIYICSSYAFCENMESSPDNCKKETYACPKTEAKFNIDGKLDEDAWRNAPASRNFRWRLQVPGSGEPPVTYFKCLEDGNSLYVGIVCKDTDAAKIRNLPRLEGGALMDSNSVEIFLAPDGKTFSYYQFAIGASGSIWQKYFIEGGNTQGGTYNPIIKYAVNIGDSEWIVEIKFPLNSLYYTNSSDFSGKWLMNVVRTKLNPLELTTWSPVDRSFHEISKYNILENAPLKSPRFDLNISNLECLVTDENSSGDVNGNVAVRITAGNKAFGPYVMNIRDEKGNPVVPNAKIEVSKEDETFIFPKLKLPWKGKNKLTATIADNSGDQVFGAYFPITVQYKPIEVEITEPFYANCIFPGQCVKSITGKVRANLPDEKLEGAAVCIALKREKEGNLKIVDGLLKNRSFEFSFDSGILREGGNDLEFEISNAGKKLAFESINIRKLPEPGKGNCVYIDKNLNMVVDGKPIFVRGWSGTEGYMTSQALLDKYPHPDSPFVNVWGAGVGAEAERIDPSEKENVKKDVVPSEKVFKEMKTRINGALAERKVLYYYLADEPSYRQLSASYLKQQYDFIKKEDPYHPVMSIDISYDLYKDCLDIFNPHPYSNPVVDSRGKRSMKNPALTGREIRKAYEVSNWRKPCWLTPQAFSYLFSGMKNSDYPNFDEFNCVVFTAIANGCKGFTPFLYGDHFNSLDLRMGIPFIYESLAALDEFLLLHPKPEKINVESSGGAVEARLMKSNGKILLVMVNTSDGKSQVSIRSPLLEGINTLYGFREGDKINISAGCLDTTLAPYQVRLLTSLKMDDGLKSLGDFRAELEKAKSELHKPGNIMYGKVPEIEWDSSDTYIVKGCLKTLADGVCDALGWRHTKGSTPPFVELKFLKSAVTFKKAVIYSSTIEDLELWVLKDGEMVKISEIKGNKEKSLTFNLPEPVRTLKIKFVVSKIRTDKTVKQAEMYEIELYE